MRFGCCAVVVLLAQAAYGQVPGERADNGGALSESPRTATESTTTGMTVRPPGDTEVLQAERGVLNPQGVLSVPLEEPLDPNKYICGRGDTFELNFWGAQNFKLRVTVDLEGRTFISKVGYVSVVGKTLSEARTIIKQSVRRFYPGLNFDLTLAVPRTFLVNIIGYVPHPGQFTANPLQRLSTVLANAADLQTTRQKTSLAPVPAGAGSKRRITIRHRDGTTGTADLLMYELTGDHRFNPFLMDGDIVDIPYADTSVIVDGPVHRPGTYELVAAKDLDELLKLAGGLRSDVTRTLPIRVIRRHDEKATQFEVPFSSDSFGKFTLKDGDLVRIPSQEDLQKSVLVLAPTATDAMTIKRVGFAEGATVRSILEGVGTLAATADLKNSYVKRASGEVERIDLEELLVRRNFSADRPAHVGDTIVVPRKEHSVLVSGAVLRPGAYPWRPNFGPSEYLAIAGGPAKNAQSSSNYTVISDEGHKSRVTNRTSISPGDTIMVPERSFSRSEIVQLVLGGAGLLLSGVSVAILLLRY